MKKFISLLLLFCSLNLSALSAVSGTFEATQSCPAYMSKKHKTNPDNLHVQPSQIYQLKEINKNPPDWLRIEIVNDRKTLRWVSAQCGTTEYTEKKRGTCDNRAGMADAHVLALS